jgi:hypothetical protein
VSVQLCAPAALPPGGKKRPLYIRYSGLSGLRNRCGRFREEMCLLSSPYCSLYIDYAVPAPIVLMSLKRKENWYGEVFYRGLIGFFLSPHVDSPHTEPLDTPQ